MTRPLFSTEVFLERFFSAPNRSALTAELGPWVARLRTSPPTPTVLPCRRDEGVEWYGIAFSDVQLKALGELLTAFVGPSYSTFRGERAHLSAEDPIDAAVLALTRRAFKFTGPARPIWGALERMRVAIARRPDDELERPRSTGRLLRDFYMALRAQRGDLAASHLEALGERLTPANVLFLRVQMLVEIGDWGGLLARPEVPDLLQMRRPVAVTEALLQAVYHVELERFESDPLGEERGLAHFRQAVTPQFGALLGHRAGIRAPAAVKLLMYEAVAGTPPSQEARDALWQTRGIPEDDRLFLKRLADRLPATAPAPQRERSDVLASAAAALDRGEYERALALAVAASPGPARARLIVVCAYEMQTLEAERAAVAAIAELGAADRERALIGRRYRDMYTALSRPTFEAIYREGEDGAAEAAIQGPTGEAQTPRSTTAPQGGTAAAAPLDPQIPTGWPEWFERVTAEPTWRRAVDVARKGAQQWSVEDLLDSADGVEQFVANLGGSAASVDVVQQALPHLLAFFRRDAYWPRRELAPVYYAMLETLTYGSRGATEDLLVFSDLAQVLLQSGLTQDQYEQVVAFASYLLTEEPAPSRLGWALDLLDLLIEYPCPGMNARLSFLVTLAGEFRRHWGRVDSPDWDLLQSLATDLGQSAIYDQLVAARPTESSTGAPGAQDVLIGLAGKQVAIYTLTESVAKRVGAVLRSRVPGVDVTLAHDRVGSDRLRELARRADIFLMATASATHAATQFIETHRPASRPTLKPGGKGSASMLHALYGYLSSVQSAPGRSD